MKMKVGNTPIIKIKYEYNGKENYIYTKLEAFNITGSIKDRVAYYIINEAYKEGKLKKGMEIVEATSGNTGIALAAMGAYFGNSVRIYMPNWVSKERISLMKMYNAEVVLVSRKEGGFKKAIELAKEYAKNNNAFLSNQFENENNILAHYKTTGKEIIDKLSPKKLENDIFKLIDEIGNKNSSHAMKIVTDMILEGESVLGIFAMVSKQFKLVIQARQLQVQGYTSKTIAEKIGAHPFVVTKALKQGKQFNDEVIVDMLNFILESDYKIKNGLIKDNLAVEILVSKYCQ